MDQHENDVRIMAERLAMLYYYFVKELAGRYGEEEATAIARQVVAEYGAECGRLTRSKVEEQGLKNNLANHHLGGDLPQRGWDTELLALSETEKVVKTTFCPMAATWQRYGCEEWGRIYCDIDPAKFHTYNENLIITSPQNVLDGDEYCLLKVEMK